MDLVGEAEAGGVQIAQQAIAERRIGLDGLLYGSRVKLRVRCRLQQAQVARPIGGHRARRPQLRLAEEIALKVLAAGLFGGNKLFLGLHLLGQDADAAVRVLFRQSRGFLRGSNFHIHLEKVGQVDQRFAGVIHHKIVEREHVPGLLEALAGGDHLFFRRYVPQ
jgi:hypothetical protein